MAETHPPTRITEKSKRARRGRVRDARSGDVGLDDLETERRSEGVGYAEDRDSPATEHKPGRTDDGPAT